MLCRCLGEAFAGDDAQMRGIVLQNDQHKVESVTVQSSAYPYCDSAAMFDAQLPGSMNPTVTSRPGQRYLRNAAALLLVSCDLKNDFQFFSYGSLLQGF